MHKVVRSEGRVALVHKWLRVAMMMLTMTRMMGRITVMVCKIMQIMMMVLVKSVRLTTMVTITMVMMQMLMIV